MTRAGGLLAGVAAVTTLLSACSSHPATPHPATSPAPPAATTNGAGTAPVLLSCVQGIDAGPSALIGLSVISGVVALPVGTVLQASPTGDDAPGALFAKQGLEVRAGVVFDLEISPDWAAHARIGWGSPSTPGTRLHVGACAGTDMWLGYPGGYWVDKPMCLPLIVRTDGRQETVDISVGVQCPAN